MKIGFYTKFTKGKGSKKKYVGEQMYAEDMCDFFRKMEGVQAELYSPDDFPNEMLDFIIYLNDTAPIKGIARKHILYFQNFYPQGSIKMLDFFEKQNYDGYIFVSKKVWKKHLSRGFKGVYLPFSTDITFFYPRKESKELTFDVSYIGNDIKGVERSTKYLLPATDFNFALFGSWGKPKRQILRELISFKNPLKRPIYQKTFMKISRGRISRKNSTVLYSSSKINLNCHGEDAIKQGIITGRVLDILACKGFLISDSSPEMEKELKGGYVSTKGSEDLKEKIKYYLNHPKKRKEIAERGYKLIRNKYSMEKRVNELYNYLQSLK